MSEAWRGHGVSLPYLCCEQTPHPDVRCSTAQLNAEYHGGVLFEGDTRWEPPMAWKMG